MCHEFQIWAIHTESGPISAMPVSQSTRGSLSKVIKYAQRLLESSDWFGVGVKVVGEVDWSFVTYRDEPLLEKKRHSGTAAQRHVDALPMAGNPVCVKG